MSSLLEKLPNEVIGLIFEALREVLPWKHDAVTKEAAVRKEFGRVSLVCRRIHYLSAPFLYHTVTCGGIGRSIRPFLRTICSRPDLARHVSYLGLDWFTDWELKVLRERKEYPYSEAGDIEDHLFSDTAASIGREGLAKALEDKTQEPQVMLLLHLLPAVQTLDLSPPESVPSLLNAAMKSVVVTADEEASVPDLPQALRSVKEVRWTFHVSGPDYNAQYMPLLYGMRLPSTVVTSAYATYTKTWIADPALTRSLYKTSSVHTLSFIECVISAAVFDHLLRIPKELRVFSYHLCEYRPGFKPPHLEIFDPESFGRALRHVRYSLERLKLRAYAHQVEGVKSIGLLRDFPKLTHIDTTLRVLLGPNDVRSLPEILPASLEELILLVEKLYCDNDIFVSYGLELIKRSNQSLPCLKSIRFIFDEVDNRECLVKLKEAAALQKVELKLEKWYDNDGPDDALFETRDSDPEGYITE